jgi:Flp pilus assembly protein TadG
MKRLVPRFGRSTKGQALVEFALVMPMALVLIMGVWEFGRGWNAYQTLTDAAREGARLTAVSNAAQPALTNVQIETNVVNAINLRLVAAALDPLLSVTDVTGENGGIGTPAIVSITYLYQINYVGALLQWTTGEKNVTLRTSFAMRNE